MKKQGNKNVPCAYCDKLAETGTYPPVCQEHKKIRKKASGGLTLKELEDKASR